VETGAGPEPLNFCATVETDHAGRRFVLLDRWLIGVAPALTRFLALFSILSGMDSPRSRPSPAARQDAHLHIDRIDWPSLFDQMCGLEITEISEISETSQRSMIPVPYFARSVN
jgi:hypothetical protein